MTLTGILTLINAVIVLQILRIGAIANLEVELSTRKTNQLATVIFTVYGDTPNIDSAPDQL